VQKTRDRSGAAGGGAELFTVDQLVKISRNPDPVLYDLAGDRAALVPEMKKGGIVTKNQIAAFLANVCQETAWLKTLEEFGDEAYFRYGALRRPPGKYLQDQWRYHGRGYIMNTWRSAYERLSDVLGVDLVSNPDLLSERKDLAARAAVWFWTTNNIGPVADRGDFRGVCSLINRGENPPQGPINGWTERLEAYERARAVIGTGTEPVGESEAPVETKKPKITTAVEGTNFYEALEYVRPLIGNMLYWVWMGGDVPDGEGMYAVNKPLPPSGQLLGRRINCAGATNLFFRAVGKRVPTRGFPRFDGGVAAYFDSPTINAQFGTVGYFHGHDEPFNLAKAKQWAEETRSGVLIGRPYVNETLGGQGHVAILLPSGYVLQSFQFGPNGQPGLNWDYTIEESNEGGYYTRMVAPWNWSEYEGDTF